MKLVLSVLMMAGMAFLPLVAQTVSTSIAGVEGGGAESAATAQGPGFEDLEDIFREQLKARHIPLLGSYLSMLQSLAADAVDPAPYQEEIRRVQGWIEAGGVVNLLMARNALGTEDKMAEPEPEPVSRRIGKLGPLGERWIVLTPDLARDIEPDSDAEGLSNVEGLEVHSVEWRIEYLPEGQYEVVLRYASVDDRDLATPVRVIFAGQRLDDEVPPVKRDKSDQTMRLAGLGRLQVIAPLEGEVLTFHVLGGEDARIRLKEIIIAPQSPLQRGKMGN